MRLRSHLYGRLERLAAEPTLRERGALTFTVVGGGATGVELAGALAELLRRVPLDFPELNVTPSVVLLERLGTLLSGYGQRSRQHAEVVLRRRGVEVRLNTAVKAVRSGKLELEGGEIIPCGSVIRTAGLRAGPLAPALGVGLTRGDRVKVGANLSLEDHPEGFVVGDMAGAADEHGTLYPQVAQVAIQQGKHAAKEIRRRLSGEPSVPFHYTDLGNMAIIGRGAAVAEFGTMFFGLRLRGLVGWLAWLFVHLMKLYGLQDRAHVLLSWVYEAVTHNRPARLVLGEPNQRGQAVTVPEGTPVSSGSRVAEHPPGSRMLAASR